MDLQTMLRKVKQKQYKSKKEFQDDLDLIWANCWTYNATEVRSVFIFFGGFVRGLFGGWPGMGVRELVNCWRLRLRLLGARLGLRP